MQAYLLNFDYPFKIDLATNEIGSIIPSNAVAKRKMGNLKFMGGGDEKPISK